MGSLRLYGIATEGHCDDVADPAQYMKGLVRMNICDSFAFYKINYPMQDKLDESNDEWSGNGPNGPGVH